MTFEEPYLERYKKLRTGWWLGLTAAWLGFWYYFLTDKPKAARDCEGLLDQIGCGLGDDISTLSVLFGIVLALVTSPILLIPARFIARHVTEQEIAADAARLEKQAVAEAQAFAAAQRKRRAASERQETVSRQAIHRGEFLHKLGAVSDLLRLLADEEDRNEVRQIKVGVVQSLRDLTAKHTLDELARLIRADSAIGLAVPPVLDALAKAGLDSAPEATILDAAMHRAHANT